MSCASVTILRRFAKLDGGGCRASGPSSRSAASLRPCGCATALCRRPARLHARDGLGST